MIFLISYTSIPDNDMIMITGNLADDKKGSAQGSAYKNIKISARPRVRLSPKTYKLKLGFL
jgi:hypothetical protein